MNRTDVHINMVRIGMFGACCALLMFMSMTIIGCAAQQVVYHDVPEWQLREGVITTREWVDADGVRHVYRPRRVQGARTIDASDANTALGQYEDEHGVIRSRALMPEQVVAQLVNCLVEEDYEFLWDEVLAEQTKREYMKVEDGYEEFERFFRENRDDMYAMLNRMSIELRSPSVLHEQGPHGGQRVRFHPHFATEYKFHALDLVWEENALRVVMIHPTYGE